MVEVAEVGTVRVVEVVVLAGGSRGGEEVSCWGLEGLLRERVLCALVVGDVFFPAGMLRVVRALKWCTGSCCCTPSGGGRSCAVHVARTVHGGVNTRAAATVALLRIQCTCGQSTVQWFLGQ